MRRRYRCEYGHIFWGKTEKGLTCRAMLDPCCPRCIGTGLSNVVMAPLWRGMLSTVVWPAQRMWAAITRRFKRVSKVEVVATSGTGAVQVSNATDTKSLVTFINDVPDAQQHIKIQDNTIPNQGVLPVDTPDEPIKAGDTVSVNCVGWEVMNRPGRVICPNKQLTKVAEEENNEHTNT